MNEHNYGYCFLRKSLFSHHTCSDEDKLDLSVNMVGPDTSFIDFDSTVNSNLILNSIGFNPSSKLRNKYAFIKAETDVKVLCMPTEAHVYKNCRN